MKVFHVSWNDPETVFHEMPWKKNFTVYPSLKRIRQKKDMKKVSRHPDFIQLLTDTKDLSFVMLIG